DFVAPSGGGILRIATTDISGPMGYADGSYGHPDYCYAIDYTGFNGTSAAAPQVAGVIALMIQRDPDITREDVFEILRNTAKKIGPVPYIDGRNDYMGYGLVDGDDAVKEVVRRKVVREVKDRRFPLSGYFVRIGNGAFDWVYVSFDRSVVAKLDGMNDDGTLRWDPILKDAFSNIEVTSQSIIFSEATLNDPLALALSGQIFSIAGYFTRFGNDVYDWIYVDRVSRRSFKLEGLGYYDRFLWIDLPLQATINIDSILF
ncbi:MAG: S8 family serine peptidase, partial [Epsilonproteobacteria bacterium]|nr:S8 family serine peptidase [Campylobacterota bacterium]